VVQDKQINNFPLAVIHLEELLLPLTINMYIFAPFMQRKDHRDKANLALRRLIAFEGTRAFTNSHGPIQFDAIGF